MPISIKDVAARAGVSRGTVSHVLNGNEQARISATTQQRVWQAANELGYHPNRIARSLGRRRTDIIGVILPRLTNPFFVQIMEDMEKYAAELGYQVLLDATGSNEASAVHAKLRGWPVDGVVMWAADPTCFIADLLGASADNLPVVYISGLPREDDSDAVTFNVYEGARIALQYLFTRGYRKIGFLYPYDWVPNQPAEPRHRAYRDVCTETGLMPRMIRMSRQEETRHSGLIAGLELAGMSPSERPDAVFCFNDVTAEGVLFGLRRAGLKTPHDVAVVGMDGIPSAQFLDVPLTTVHLPTDILCHEAVRILQQRIHQGGNSQPQQVVVPAYLVAGDTA